MTITTVPPWPLRSENLTQTVFSARAEASLQAISPAIDDINALTSAYSNGTNATSSTSNSIGTGAKTFTVPTGLGYQIGMTLRIANSATAYMTGDVSSYDSSTGSLVMNITSVNGSGTYASWTFSLAAIGAVPSKASQATAEAGSDDNDYMTALKTSQAIAVQVAANFVSPGTFIDSDLDTAPPGYLVCPTSPTNISRTTYAALFAAIGTKHGSGDGSTTFGMPWFPADYAAVQANSNVGTSTVGEVIAHTHTYTKDGTTSGGLYNAGSEGDLTANTGSTGGAANKAAGVRVLKCVKY